MFTTFFYQPIYNLSAFALTVAPLHDVGTAIILVTIVVKVILLPLNAKAVKSSYIMKRLEGELKDLKKKHKHNPQELGKRTLALYKDNKINPFSAIFSILIQMPILYALYKVFSVGLASNDLLLYSFVTFPNVLHTTAFGFIDVTKSSVLCALLTGITAFVLAKQQTKRMTVTVKDAGEEETFSDHFQKSMKMQLTYVFPVLFTGIAFALPAALSLYWITSNIVSLIQDVILHKKFS